MPKAVNNEMCSPFSFLERKNKLRYSEIYTYWCQNTVVAQSKRHPAFGNGVAFRMDTTAIYLQARRVKWQKDKLVIQNHSHVLFATS